MSFDRQRIKEQAIKRIRKNRGELNYSVDYASIKGNNIPDKKKEVLECNFTLEKLRDVANHKEIFGDDVNLEEILGIETTEERDAATATETHMTIMDENETN